MENANNAEVNIDVKGIGIPATKAGIMERIIKTGLVECESGKKIKYLIPTHKSIALVKTYEVIKNADTLFPRQNTGNSVESFPRCGVDVIESKKVFHRKEKDFYRKSGKGPYLKV